jgi:HlyD family secretion protein
MPGIFPKNSFLTSSIFSNFFYNGMVREEKILMKLPLSLKSPRVLILSSVILVACIVSGVYFWKTSHPKEASLLTAEVRSTNLEATISASGNIEAEQSLNLSFENAGTVNLVAVKQGKEVKTGELLLAQDDSDQKAQLASAQANLDSAKARLEELRNGSLPEEIEQARATVAASQVNKDTVQAQYERVKALYEQGVATAKELDDAQKSYTDALTNWQQAQSKLTLLEKGTRPEQIRQAEASVASAEAQLSLARNRIEATRLRAPFDGASSPS